MKNDSLINRAIKAAKIERAEALKRSETVALEEARRLVREFEEVFNVKPNYELVREGERFRPRLLVENLIFQKYWGDSSTFVLGGICPQCGAKTWSRPIRSLADLGKMLEYFEPGVSHRCEEEQPEPDLADRLRAVLRELIKER